MPYRSIMVHMDQSQDALKRARLAKGLADSLDAHLIGLSAAEISDVALVGGLPPAFVQARETELRDCCAALGDHFLSVAQGRSAEWRSDLGSPAEVLARHAGAADLIVVGRAGADAAGPEFHLSPVSALMKTGRPVLIVPAGVETLSADRIVVAWKTGRAAALAVELALPLLIRASQVMVLGVGDETAQAELDDVCRFLIRHGVKAETHWRGLIGLPVDKAIVEAAGRAKADLIVCGGYGRPHLLEWALGGATEGLIASSPWCCLMAH
jgi:nucleotide-binding universal stress UspA family protein